MAKKILKVVLNDETKVNTYGFKILNSGIDLTRFLSNPVMLNQHNNSTSAVIGRWNNPRIERSLLVADAEFDLNDIEAAALAGKVERGFIKGASMGLLFHAGNMVSEKDGTGTLKKCELLEASICAIPSNANSIVLYANATGEKLTETQIKQSLTFSQTDNKKLNMDLLKTLFTLLKLPDTASEQDVIDEVTALQTAQESVNNKKVENAIQLAITDGKILLPQKQFFLNAAENDLDGTLKYLQQLPKRVKLSSLVNNKNNAEPGEDRSKWKLDDWRQKASEELEKNQALYKKLCADEGIILEA